MKTYRFLPTSTLKIILAVVLGAIAAAQTLRAATVATDRIDYPPFSDVDITGTGFGSNEGVTVRIDEVNPDGTQTFVAAWSDTTTDGSGKFTTVWYIFSDDFIGATLRVTATGQSSSLSAATTFTDADFPTVGLPNGTAPVDPPAGGFAMDGNLQANTPTNGVGDWIPGSAGAGGYVLTNAGGAVDPSLTFHLTDVANVNNQDDVFTTGAQLNDNPTAWHWKLGNANNSSDINHALIHITKSTNGHIWAVVSSDRFSANGDSATDFEFLQNTLTKNTNLTFTSQGPHGGRTTNDFILSVTFKNGGTVPALAILQWKEVSSGVFSYVASTETALSNLITAGVVYGAVNTNAISVPYGAFGGTNYPNANTFAEVAVDLTGLLGSFNECETLGVKTIFVKTRQSQSATSSCDDFVEPQQILPPLVIGPAAFAGANQTNCSASATTTFTMNGSVQPGTNPLNGTNWVVVSGPATIANSNSLTTTVTLTGTTATATLRLTVTDSGACTNNFTSDDVILTVLPLPPCTFTNDTNVVVNGSGNHVAPGGRYTFTGPAGMSAYSWLITPNGTAPTVIGNTTSQLLTLDLPESGLTSFTNTLTVTSTNGCQSTCSQTYVVDLAAQADCAVTGNPSVCPSTSQNHTVDPNVPPGQPINSYSWAFSTNTTGATFVGATTNDTVSVNAGTNCGTYTVVVTINYGSDKTKECETTVVVESDPPVFTGCPTESINLGCNPARPTCTNVAALMITATNACSGSITPVCSAGPVVTNGCGRSQTFTLRATDICTNSATCSVTYFWTEVTAPAFSNCTGGTTNLGCNPTPPACDNSIAATNQCGAVTVTCTPGTIETNGCNRTQSFTYTAGACGLTNTCTRTFSWTVVTTPVFSNCTGGTTNLGCNPTPPACDNSIAATNQCGAVTVTCTPGTIETNGCNRTQSFIYTAGACGLTNTCTRTFSWTVVTTPVFSNCTGGSTNLSCNPTPPVCDNSIAATNECGAVNVTCTPGTIETNGCNRSQSFTYRAGACGLTNTCTRTFTWTVVTTPVFSNCTGGTTNLGCNPTLPTCDATVAATNECGAVNVTCTPGTIETNGCNRSHSFTYRAGACGLTNTCTRTFTWTEDTTLPTFTGCPTNSIDLGCNPPRPTCTNVAALAITATNECSGSITPVCSAGTVVTNGCSLSQIFTLTATDACTNSATCYVTYTWTEVTTPVFTNCVGGTNNLGCNPTPPACDNSIAATNECGAVTVTCTPGSIYTNGCNRTQRFTYRAGACGLTNTCTRTFTWTVVTAPVFDNCVSGITNLGCNPVSIPNCTTGPTITAHNECGPVEVTCVLTYEGDVSTCSHSRTLTYTALACGLSNTCARTYTWTLATTPVFINCPGGTTNLGCNPTLPVCNTVAATNQCGTVTVTCTPGTIQTNGCSRTQSFTYRAGGCGLTNTCIRTFNWTQDTTPPVFTNLPPATTNYQCYADVPAASFASTNVTANDNCDGPVTVSFNETQSNTNSSCTNTIRRCWIAYDSCHNTNKFTQTITVNDTTAPVISCATNIIMNCGTCTADPEVTGKATATNATCSGSLVYDGTNAPSAGKITYQDSATDTNSCGWTITRTWTATDQCGNQSTCLQTITCIPSTSEIIVTDSSLCTYDLDLTTTCKDFRLLFTQDPQNFPCYKLTASNPGQTYFNLYYIGTPSNTVTFNLSIPHPYVTQGAQPIHAYDNVTFSGSAPQRCLTPGRAIPITSITPSNIVTLANHPGGANAIVTVTLTVPPSGFVYLNVHLDFGLKKTSGFAKGTDDNATSCTSTNILIPNRNNYLFSVSGATSGGDSICNINVFKKLPGVGGLAGTKYTTFDGVSGSIPKQGCTALLKDAKNVVLATGITDSDGWYFCSYKWTGKATTLYLTLTPPGGTPITKTISLKSNGYAQADFDVP